VTFPFDPFNVELNIELQSPSSNFAFNFGNFTLVSVCAVRLS